MRLIAGPVSWVKPKSTFQTIPTSRQNRDSHIGLDYLAWFEGSSTRPVWILPLKTVDFLGVSSTFSLKSFRIKCLKLMRFLSLLQEKPAGTILVFLPGWGDIVCTPAGDFAAMAAGWASLIELDLQHSSGQCCLPGEPQSMTCSAKGPSFGDRHAQRQTFRAANSEN